jgi:predicted AAA+ superfamily ATPase
MIDRPHHVAEACRLLDQFPVVALIGARQVGKTTLARAIAARRTGPVHHFDLEDPRTEARFASPMLVLEGLRGLVVLDEIQRHPELFAVLRVLADRAGTPARFLILGSASPELMQHSAESLAGRIAYHELPGFDLTETGAAAMDTLWLRGGFPKSLLAAGEPASLRWRKEFVRS